MSYKPPCPGLKSTSMKSFFLLSIFLFAAFLVQAQTYESIKTELTLLMYKKAKEDIDRKMNDATFRSKPEAYILKTTIYAGLSMEKGTKGTAAGDQFLNEAEAAFKKYREMDPSMALFTDPVYQNGPINIYSALFSSGYKDYENKNWQSSFAKFKRVVEYSDLLIAKQIIAIAADTNSLLLAGITAENANLKDEAARYYGRLADLKVPGSGFENVYRYLVRYYFIKKNMVAFEKYRATGKELYPENEFFNYDKTDFAVGLEEGFNKKMLAVERLIATDPNNQRAQQLLGELIYDTLNSRSATAALPANAEGLEKKMINAFNRSAALKPGYEIPFIYIGDHFINKSDRVNVARSSHAAKMKALTNAGTEASKEDLAEKDALTLQYITALEAALVAYEKAAAIYIKKQMLSSLEKQQYKKVAAYLADIFADKKKRAKENPADLAKFTAEEKKWNDVYDSIK
jgi:hypothetical protein